MLTNLDHTAGMQAGVMKNKKVQGGQWGVSVWRLINTQGRLCLALGIDLMAKPLAPSLCDTHLHYLIRTRRVPCALATIDVFTCAFFQANRWHSFNRASWSHLLIWTVSFSFGSHTWATRPFCLIYARVTLLHNYSSPHILNPIQSRRCDRNFLQFVQAIKYIPARLFVVLKISNIFLKKTPEVCRWGCARFSRFSFTLWIQFYIRFFLWRTHVVFTPSQKKPFFPRNYQS